MPVERVLGTLSQSSCLCHRLVKQVDLTWVRHRRHLVFLISHKCVQPVRKNITVVHVIVEGFSPKLQSIVEVNSPKWGDQSARHIESEPRTSHLSAPITQLSKQRFHHERYWQTKIRSSTCRSQYSQTRTSTASSTPSPKMTFSSFRNPLETPCTGIQHRRMAPIVARAFNPSAHI